MVMSGRTRGPDAGSGGGGFFGWGGGTLDWGGAVFGWGGGGLTGGRRSRNLSSILVGLLNKNNTYFDKILIHLYFLRILEIIKFMFVHK